MAFHGLEGEDPNAEIRTGPSDEGADSLMVNRLQEAITHR